jgi:hypothetical protein
MPKFVNALIFVLLGFSITACSGNASVGYQPPNLPVKISIDTNGQLSVSWENSIQTPIGIFSAEVSSDLSELYQDRNGVLIVNVNGVNSVYDLNEQNNVVITLESGYYRQVELRKEGNNWYFEATRVSSELPSPLQESDLYSESTEAPSIIIPTSFTCPKAPTSRLKVGSKAIVIEATTRLRSESEVSDNIIFLLAERDILEITDGPICSPRPDRSDYFVFWKVVVPSRSLEGWVAEGDSDFYFIQPYQ